MVQMPGLRQKPFKISQNYPAGSRILAYSDIICPAVLQFDLIFTCETAYGDASCLVSHQFHRSGPPLFLHQAAQGIIRRLRLAVSRYKAGGRLQPSPSVNPHHVTDSTLGWANSVL